ncbi:MAG TPA: hypothetical protein VMT87_16850, partial [Vicinamibacteria bacterium]|nr:hypothetical protein [Vicinamibacteria bacterium]
ARGDIASVRRSVIESPLRRWIDVKGSKLGVRSVLPVAWELVRLTTSYSPRGPRGIGSPRETRGIGAG